MKEVKIIEVNLDFFIKAVEDNNIYNDGKWEDWQDGLEILEVYAESNDYIEYIYDEEKDYIINELNNKIANS